MGLKRLLHLLCLGVTRCACDLGLALLAVLAFLGVLVVLGVLAASLVLKQRRKVRREDVRGHPAAHDLEGLVVQRLVLLHPRLLLCGLFGDVVRVQPDKLVPLVELALGLLVALHQELEGLLQSLLRLWQGDDLLDGRVAVLSQLALQHVDLLLLLPHAPAQGPHPRRRGGRHGRCVGLGHRLVREAIRARRPVESRRALRRRRRGVLRLTLGCLPLVLYGFGRRWRLHLPFPGPRLLPLAALCLVRIRRCPGSRRPRQTQRRLAEPQVPPRRHPAIAVFERRRRPRSRPPNIGAEALQRLRHHDLLLLQQCELCAVRRALVLRRRLS
mmetsp:Transcript_46710/g.145864  ORF Transcript_46710/g.145864 Transcript_46710/m.145864 type:complete len:328 (+) Transcript_46710:1275-2258(+)